jgi:hypothetical protein
MGATNSVGDKFRQPCPAPEFVGLIRGRGRRRARGRGVHANSIGSGCLRLRRFFVSVSLRTVVGPNRAATLQTLCSKIDQEASFVATRFEVIQDLRPFDLADFG